MSTCLFFEEEKEIEHKKGKKEASYLKTIKCSNHCIKRSFDLRLKLKTFRMKNVNERFNIGHSNLIETCKKFLFSKTLKIW